MHNGCILCGDVGSGKSMTALAYYYTLQGGDPFAKEYVNMVSPPQDLIIITTARKRDTLEWESELARFYLTTNPELAVYKHNVVVDSWNNIKKYENLSNTFFIFDEQRVVGNGAWVQSFLKITRLKGNDWILLSATPGDTWMDYIPVFIANGFYKNRTSFVKEHVIFSYYTKYPKVDRYVNQKKLRTIRDSILVEMPMTKQTIRHDQDVICEYDISEYKRLMRTRWDSINNKPIENASEMCYLLRRCANACDIRVPMAIELVNLHPKAIIFYNFDYELDALKEGLEKSGIPYAEWNGHKHEPVPTGKTWVYLVQYTAGSEGWNCITSDTIIFFSQNYSYKTMFQAAGRIDRLNTRYTHLYYYHMRSMAPIDCAIRKAVMSKKTFNEGRFVKWVKIQPK